MKKLTILILIFLTLGCTKKDKINDPKDFIYKVKFFPSFISKSEVEIIKTGNEGTIKFTIREDRNSKKIYKDSTKLSESDLKKFSSSLSNISLTKMKSFENYGLDGMTVYNIFYQNGKLNDFVFWSPEKGTKYYKIENAVFELMKQKFSSESAKVYLKSLELYCK